MNIIKTNSRAFTLAEMMVVLLILSIITAAMMPVITGKMRSASSSGTSIWQFVGGSGPDIFYNGGNTAGVAIGANEIPAGTSTKLLIDTRVAGQNAVVFSHNGVGQGSLKVNSNAVGLGQYSSNGSTVDNVILPASIAIGSTSRVLGDGGIAIGSPSGVYGLSAVSVGQGSAAGEYAISLGRRARASVTASGPLASLGTGSVAIGNESTASDASSIAIGTGSNSSVTSAIAIGRSAETVGSGGIAIGSGADAAATSTISIGSSANEGITANANAIAIGANTNAIGNSAIVIGQGSQTIASTTSGHAVVIGSNARATGAYCISMGTYANASSSGISIGYNSVASGSSSTALGVGARASHSGATALGYSATTTQANQVVVGSISNSRVDLYGDVYVHGTMYVDEDISVARDIAVTRDIRTNARTSGGSRRWGAIYTSDTAGDYGDARVYYSDKRLKNVDSEFTSSLDKIRELKVYNFTFKKDKEKTPQVGIIAQDLQKVFPNAVEADKKGYLRIRLEDMFYAMLNSIKELDKMVQDVVAKVQTLDDKVSALIKVDQIQSKKIKELEAKNKALEARLLKLEKAVSKSSK